MAGVWVTAGAPLESGDGWRVWYSWPAGDFTPATVRVRTPGGRTEAGRPTARGSPARRPGLQRQMGVRELRIVDATPGELYEVTVPERGRAAVLAHAPERNSPTPASAC